MNLTEDERAERARHAALRRHHPDDPGAAAGSRQRLKLLRAQDYIADLVRTPPVLTGAERARLAVVLLTGGDDAA